VSERLSLCTQLALLKHTIAFALYIDETLAIDLTDPHTMVVMAHPVTVMPSGITYSASTVEKLFADAKKLNRQPLCPQSMQPIQGQVGSPFACARAHTHTHSLTASTGRLHSFGLISGAERGTCFYPLALPLQAAGHQGRVGGKG